MTETDARSSVLSQLTLPVLLKPILMKVSAVLLLLVRGKTVADLAKRVALPGSTHTASDGGTIAMCQRYNV